MIHLHRWTQWGEPWTKRTDYTWDTPGDCGFSIKRYQNRRCERCGKIKSRRVW